MPAWTIEELEAISLILDDCAGTDYETIPKCIDRLTTRLSSEGITSHTAKAIRHRLENIADSLVKMEEGSKMKSLEGLGRPQARLPETHPRTI